MDAYRGYQYPFTILNACAGGTATLTSASPKCNDTLPKIRNNALLFTFDKTITAPAPGQVLIQKVLPRGTYGPDLSARFTFTANGNSLTIRENGVVLNNTEWYSIRNNGTWPGVANFKRDYAIVYGDANNDDYTLYEDVNYILAFLGNITTPGTVQDRADIDGNNLINSTDLNVTSNYIANYKRSKPTGQVCN